MTRASDSTIASSELISKVYFPRLVIPIAAVLAPLVDLAMATAVLFAALALYGVAFSLQMLLLPAAVLLALATALGTAVWLSALAVRFRDVVLVLPFMTQVLLFVTPVLYPLSSIPSGWRVVYSLNPLVGVLELFRWTMLPTPAPAAGLLAVSIGSAVVLIVSGVIYFTRAEQTFADVI